MNLEGERISIPSVRLYSDSYGNGPGKITPSGIYTCTRHIPGNVAPIHIDNLGWIKCYPNGMMKTSCPPVYICISNEGFTSV